MHGRVVWLVGKYGSGGGGDEGMCACMHWTAHFSSMSVKARRRVAPLSSPYLFGFGVFDRCVDVFGFWVFDR